MTKQIETPVRNDADDSEKPQPHCAECKQKLYLGDELIRLETGVLGGKGFVALPTERTIHLCNFECARRYFMIESDVKMKRRIP